MMTAEGAVIAPESPDGLEYREMVDLTGHFSNPEALREALEEMEKVLTQSSFSPAEPPNPPTA